MSARARKSLAALTALVLALAGAGFARAQDLDDEDERDSSAESNEPTAEKSAPKADAREEDTPSASDESSGDATSENEAGEDAGGATIAPFAGFGFGTRSFERPTTLGGQRLRTTAFPAADVGLHVIAWPKAAFSLGVLFRYQTSIGMKIEERPPFALPNRVGARSERAELSVAPTFRFGQGSLAPAVAFPIGAGIRTLWPEIHNGLTPGYSLIGPLVRAELHLPLTETLALRLGPEAQWYLSVGHELQHDGADSQAFAIGGEASLSLGLSPHFTLDLSYREAHAGASSVNGGSLFKDVERYATLRLFGVL